MPRAAPSCRSERVRPRGPRDTERTLNPQTPADGDADQRFPPAARLRTASDFRPVFAHGAAVRDACYTVLARPDDRGPRLGLAVSRKVSKRAVDRNRIKRIARECFRQRRATLPALDLVVIARPLARELSRAELRQRLEALFDRLAQRRPGSTSA